MILYLSVGRVDLEGGDYKEMGESITRLESIKENIILFPGHGDETTLDYEKENNPYF